MKHTRQCLNENSKWKYLSSDLENIELESHNDSGRIYDYLKVLIESICKTVLTDLGTEYSPNANFPTLVKKTISSLNERNFATLALEERRSLAKIANSLTNLIEQIGYLRNKFGRIGHGRDVDSSVINPIHSNYVANVVDATATYIITLHDQNSSIKTRSRLHYEEYPEFNEWFDEANNGYISLGTVSLIPSEALFKCDPTAYKESLLDYQNTKSEND